MSPFADDCSAGELRGNPMKLKRHVAAALAAALPAIAGAQVTVNVHWIAPDGAAKTCVVTAGADGVTMDPGGNLELDGVFGGDCPGGSAPMPPVITDGLDLAELPATSAGGAAHTVAWSADADRCSYSASVFPSPVSGWPTSGDACGTAAACASPHSVPVSLPATPGIYAFNLSCWRNGIAAPVVSQRAVAVPGTSACIAPTGLTRATVSYVEFNYTPGNGRETDSTLFENIFGYFDEVSPLRPFPGRSNLNQRVFIAQDMYVSMRFTVPATITPNTSGVLRFEETQPQTDGMSMTISKSCGDFNPIAQAPLTRGCVVNDAGPNGNITWIVGTAHAGICQLVPGETYYLNILHATLDAPLQSLCNRASCGNTIQDQIGPGSPPWP